MSEAKHTPGPWINDGSGNITHQDEQPIAFVNWTAYGEGKANALLIAEAPYLLADLQEAAATLRRYETLHRAKGTAESDEKAEVNARLAARFEATIAKATGGAAC